MRKKVVFSVLIVALFSLLPSIVPAQVQTRLRVIEASNTGTTVDPSLRDLHNQLGSLFSFTSYRLLKDQVISLSPNQPASIEATQGKSVEITQMAMQKNVVELRVRVKREGKDILNTQVRLSPERTVLIGGPKLVDGVMILAITARF